MKIGPYGRQWFPPECSNAFSKSLLKADQLAMSGNPREGLQIYRQIQEFNPISRRRISVAKKQFRKYLNTSFSIDTCDEILLGFIDWFNGFDETMKHILSIFRAANLNVSISKPEDADVLIAGCYGENLLRSNHLSDDKLVIFFFKFS